MAVIMALQEPPASASLGPQARPPAAAQPLADPESPNPSPGPSRPRFGRRDFPDPDSAGIGKIFGI
jgi:hypothetical protein